MNVKISVYVYFTFHVKIIHIYALWLYLQVYCNLLFTPYFVRHNTFEVPFNTKNLELQKMINNGNVLGFVIWIIKLIAIKMITLMTIQEMNYLFFPVKHFSNYSTIYILLYTHHNFMISYYFIYVLCTGCITVLVPLNIPARLLQ